MKEYTVFFELFGKKMKTTVTASNQEEAKRKIREKIQFFEVREVLEKDNMEDFIKDVFKKAGIL